ncbi:Glycosyltransferase involved in cell wall bisynthesis [Chitinophaga rupis]|uniref:Glycosyltransferase involved in cell wall bisynthesis n=1 Tax=Chitinophaga rupis TaxID=573321 RepID=A0A1H7LPU8_9BACT|nr:glycosyltransferase [Chitinophaga rupis]SEL00961.1 Glycosyltransferase involved in cell wall bisynthesis [Chitinophaga rupis]
MEFGNKPFFSVIIPTYNRADVLDRCLAALTKQTYQHFEVIVCDDGSKDNTPVIIEKYKPLLLLQYVYSENWGGPARPRNTGIKMAKAEWLCFLDSDDWWYANKLEKILPHCTQDYDFIYHDFDIYVKGQPTKRRIKGRALKNPVFEDLFINDNSVANSGVCARKAVIEAAGGFAEDRDLIAVEDYDLWLKCARLTEKFQYIPERLGGYDINSDNITSADMRQIYRIDKLFSCHTQFLEPGKIKAATINWSYKKGLVYQNMPDVNAARKYFLKAMRSQLPAIKLKALLRFLSLIIK